MLRKMLPNSRMVRKRMKTNPNIVHSPWKKEPGEEAACLRLETPKPDMGIAARAAGKAEISVSSVVSDARERVSQPAISGGEEGKHLLGISLGTMDTKIILGGFRSPRGHQCTSAAGAGSQHCNATSTWTIRSVSGENQQQQNAGDGRSRQNITDCW